MATLDYRIPRLDLLPFFHVFGADSPEFTEAFPHDNDCDDVVDQDLAQAADRYMVATELSNGENADWYLPVASDRKCHSENID